MKTIIDRVEWGVLQGQRPRAAGCNARLDAHGDAVRLPIVRVTTRDGASGFGLGRGIDQGKAERLVGLSFESLFSDQTGLLQSEWKSIETALWDLAGQRSKQPVYALAAKIARRSAPDRLRVPCYDTSLYFDDLHLASTAAAAQWMAQEARSGFNRGHRAFKLKVGRGARHLPLDTGTERDIAIIQSVRAEIGLNAPLMLDANNGYNLNLAKTVLTETSNCQIFWLEEAFHEDAVLYRDLKDWLAERELSVLVADGEGEASPSILEMARQGWVDVIQYDVLDYGFTNWIRLGPQLAAQGNLAAPHHYGTLFGNYCACHLAAALETFTFAEWDEAATPGLDATGYTIENGVVQVPALPGFGLALVEEDFQRAIRAGGGVLSL